MINLVLHSRRGRACSAQNIAQDLESARADHGLPLLRGARYATRTFFVWHNNGKLDTMHDHTHPTYQVLRWSILFTLSFAAIEAVTGYFANSLTLMGDAGHMVSDSFALAISAFASWIALRPPSDKHTYGLGRAEVIVAWLSSLLMLLICVIIIIKALERFESTQTVQSFPVILVGFVGLLSNLAVVFILNRGEKTLNLRAALLHVIGDALGSLAALLSGIVIYFTHWMLIDPILSIFIALLILASSIQLLRESFTVLMEGVPKEIDLKEIVISLTSIHSVKSVHDLHVWTLSSGQIMFTAHVEVNNMHAWEKTLTEISLLLKNKYHIEHVTIQPESIEKVIHFKAKKKSGGCHDGH